MHLLKPGWVAHGEGAIYAVDVQPGSLRFATGGADGKVKIWLTAPLLHERLEVDARARAPVFVGATHQGGVLCLRWSPDGKRLASGDEDGTVVVWEHRPGRPPSGTLSAAGECGPASELWFPAAILRGHKQPGGDVNTLAWCPGSRYLASGANDARVLVWDVGGAIEEGGVCEGGRAGGGSGGGEGKRGGAKKDGEASAAASVAPQAPGAVSYRGVVVTHPVADITEHRGYVQGLSWDPFGRFLVSSGDDKRVLVWGTPFARAGRSGGRGASAAADTAGASSSSKKKKSSSAKGAASPSAPSSSSAPATVRTYLLREVSAGGAYAACPGRSAFRRADWAPDGSVVATTHAYVADRELAACARVGLADSEGEEDDEEGGSSRRQRRRSRSSRRRSGSSKRRSSSKSSRHRSDAMSDDDDDDKAGGSRGGKGDGSSGVVVGEHASPLLARDGFGATAYLTGHRRPVTATRFCPALVSIRRAGDAAAVAAQPRPSAALDTSIGSITQAAASGHAPQAEDGGAFFTTPLLALGSNDRGVSLWAPAPSGGAPPGAPDAGPLLSLANVFAAPVTDLAWGAAVLPTAFQPLSGPVASGGAAASSAVVPSVLSIAQPCATPAAGAHPFLLAASIDGTLACLLLSPPTGSAASASSSPLPDVRIASADAAAAHAASLYGLQASAVASAIVKAAGRDARARAAQRRAMVAAGVWPASVATQPGGAGDGLVPLGDDVDAPFNDADVDDSDEEDDAVGAEENSDGDDSDSSSGSDSDGGRRSSRKRRERRRRRKGGSRKRRRLAGRKRRAHRSSDEEDSDDSSDNGRRRRSSSSRRRRAADRAAAAAAIDAEERTAGRPGVAPNDVAAWLRGSYPLYGAPDFLVRRHEADAAALVAAAAAAGEPELLRRARLAVEMLPLSWARGADPRTDPAAAAALRVLPPAAVPEAPADSSEGGGAAAAAGAAASAGSTSSSGSSGLVTRSQRRRLEIFAATRPARLSVFLPPVPTALTEALLRRFVPLPRGTTGVRVEPLELRGSVSSSGSGGAAGAGAGAAATPGVKRLSPSLVSGGTDGTAAAGSSSGAAASSSSSSSPSLPAPPAAAAAVSSAPGGRKRIAPVMVTLTSAPTTTATATVAMSAVDAAFTPAAAGVHVGVSSPVSGDDTTPRVGGLPLPQQQGPSVPVSAPPASDWSSLFGASSPLAQVLASVGRGGALEGAAAARPSSPLDVTQEAAAASRADRAGETVTPSLVLRLGSSANEGVLAALEQRVSGGPARGALSRSASSGTEAAAAPSLAPGASLVALAAAAATGTPASSAAGSASSSALPKLAVTGLKLALADPLVPPGCAGSPGDLPAFARAGSAAIAALAAAEDGEDASSASSSRSSGSTVVVEEGAGHGATLGGLPLPSGATWLTSASLTALRRDYDAEERAAVQARVDALKALTEGSGTGAGAPLQSGAPAPYPSPYGAYHPYHPPHPPPYGHPHYPPPGVGGPYGWAPPPPPGWYPPPGTAPYAYPPPPPPPHPYGYPYQPYAPQPAPMPSPAPASVGYVDRRAARVSFGGASIVGPGAEQQPAAAGSYPPATPSPAAPFLAPFSSPAYNPAVPTPAVAAPSEATAAVVSQVASLLTSALAQMFSLGSIGGGAASSSGGAAAAAARGDMDDEQAER